VVTPDQRAADRPGKPDPDAAMVAQVLAASSQPLTTELLVSAANAYAALRSSRERKRPTS
jgi:hypothetical protein